MEQKDANDDLLDAEGFTDVIHVHVSSSAGFVQQLSHHGLLLHVVMMPTAAFSHSPDGSQWTAALLLHRKAV